MKDVFLKFSLIIILMISVFILPIFYPTGIAIYFRLFLLLLILIESLNLFKIVFIDKKFIHGYEPQSKLWGSYPPLRGIVQLANSATLRFRNWSLTNKIITNAATVLFSIFVIFILLEAVFMFIPRSHFYDQTLASKLWYAKYYKPINSLDFRDNEPAGINHLILFVGDSFTAGSGLKSVNDRFSDIVGKELNKTNKKYTIINIGKPSADSLGEYNLMKHFIYMTKIKPEKIFLQYFGNDIEYVAAENGMKFGGFKTYAEVSKFLIPAVAGSYLINYIYWLLPREYIGESYITFLAKAYKNDNILSKHKDELRLFVDYARENSIQLTVVIFPFLTDTAMSDSMYVNDIVNFFKASNVSTINVSQLVRDIPVTERIVNKNDAHPSKEVNRMVAREILKIM